MVNVLSTKPINIYIKKKKKKTENYYLSIIQHLTAKNDLQTTDLKPLNK
jgi:hypothetical protein